MTPRSATGPRAVEVAVAAPNRASADAALRAAELGGGAVDAAVSAALVAMVTEPGVVSLAGGAYVTVWPAGSPDAVVVDAYVAMPGLGRPPGAVNVHEVCTDYGGGLTMAAGLGTVAVPGALAGLDLAVSRWGRLPWREVVAPAYEVARDGFRLGSAAGYYLPFVRDTLFAWDSETAAALRGPDGQWLLTGDRMIVPHLADTLARIAEYGARDLFTGELAAALVADMADRGGAITARDLAEFRPLVRRPLGTGVGHWDLRTNPPPAIGGAVLAAMLALLGDPAALFAPAGVQQLADVQRRVLDVRHGVLDLADDREAAAYALLRDVGWREPVAPSTVHVSVVDSGGTACAITGSAGYSSGATVPGTGLWLNNSLGELELNRGGPLAPGERLLSNMTPTVGRDPDGAVLAIGSPGADRITTALLQVLAPFAGEGISLQEAIDRPRLHVHHVAAAEAAGTSPDEPQVEAEEGLPLVGGRPELPHRIVLSDGRSMAVRRHHRHSMYFGGVGAALLSADGELTAAADPRRAGTAASTQSVSR